MFRVLVLIGLGVGERRCGAIAGWYWVVGGFVFLMAHERHQVVEGWWQGLSKWDLLDLITINC